MGMTGNFEWDQLVTFAGLRNEARDGRIAPFYLFVLRREGTTCILSGRPDASRVFRIARVLEIHRRAIRKDGRRDRQRVEYRCGPKVFFLGHLQLAHKGIRNQRTHIRDLLDENRHRNRMRKQDHARESGYQSCGVRSVSPSSIANQSGNYTTASAFRDRAGSVSGCGSGSAHEIRRPRHFARRRFHG